MPPAKVAMPRSQRFWRPDAHQWHVPQEGMNETATWSPSATCVTLVPTSVTMPEPSWPPTTGNIDFTPIISRTSGVWLMLPQFYWHPQYRPALVRGQPGPMIAAASGAAGGNVRLVAAPPVFTDM